MKIYKHEGNGVWLGSIIIVTAINKNQAIKLVRDEIRDMGLTVYNTEINATNVEHIGNCDKPEVVFKYNGDY